MGFRLVHELAADGLTVAVACRVLRALGLVAKPGVIVSCRQERSPIGR